MGYTPLEAGLHLCSFCAGLYIHTCTCTCNKDEWWGEVILALLKHLKGKGEKYLACMCVCVCVCVCLCVAGCCLQPS